MNRKGLSDIAAPTPEADGQEGRRVAEDAEAIVRPNDAELARTSAPCLGDLGFPLRPSI